MKRPRRRIDAAPKAKIALEAPHATRFNPNPIYRRKKQLLDNAARAFDPEIGVDADHAQRTGPRAAACQDRAIDGRAGFL